MWCIFSLPWKQYINIIKHVKLIKMNYMWPSDSWWYKLLYYWNKDACVQQWLTNLFYISCLLLGPWKGKFRYLILGHFRLWYLILTSKFRYSSKQTWIFDIWYPPERNFDTYYRYCPFQDFWYLILDPPFQGPKYNWEVRTKYRRPLEIKK